MKSKFIQPLLIHIKYYLLFVWIICILFAIKPSPLSAQSNKGSGKKILFEAGYSPHEIDQKVVKAYYDVFEGPSCVYFEVADSMAYVSEVKNHDARTEGLSYGMMAAVQLNKKEVFGKIWRWTKKYLQHQDGAREAYFAWSINPQTMKKNSEGSASDGELYFITDLLFSLMHLSGKYHLITPSKN